MPDNAQNNILITRDGQACLGEFGITGSFPFFEFTVYELPTLRYMAPECFSSQSWRQEPRKDLRASDIYSFAMTSFSVRSSGVNHPPPKHNLPLTIRSSRVCCHMMAVTTTRSAMMLKAVCGHPAQRTRVRPNGCRATYGTQSQLVGTRNRNNDADSLLCTACF